MKRFGWTVEEVAMRAGESPIKVQFALKLLSLNDEIQHLVRSGNLQKGYAQILATAELDSNFQRLALRELRDNKRPTPAWFRRLCGELKEKQAQADMFAGQVFLTPDQIENSVSSRKASGGPPTPRTHNAPIKGDNPLDIIKNQVNYWLEAADEWNRLGKNFKRNECQSAVAALVHAYGALS